jgi:hypothetical protein
MSPVSPMKYISIEFLAEFHIQLLIVCKNRRGIGAVLLESEAAVIAILKFLPQDK